MNQPLTFNDRRYDLLKPIGAGGMGAVYHARDRLLKRDVALKLVLADQVLGSTPTGDTSATLLALANEFRTLAALRHPHIIDVLDYGFDVDGQPYFTMDYLDEAETILAAARAVSVERRVRLVAQMLQALAYLHRHGIVHRDLKPANVLVADRERVKMLDFGLAKGAPQPAADGIGDDEFVGTLAYTAPEVMSGYDASPASDLYAVGVMLYEIFAGTHPFNKTSIAGLIAAVVSEQPDLSPLEDTIKLNQIVDGNPQENLWRQMTTGLFKTRLLDDAPAPSPTEIIITNDTWDGLAGVVGRLLSKDPDERYPNAGATIEALCEAFMMPIPDEHESIRESFLQAARFVGRDAEMERLNELVDRAKTGVTSAILVSGESGVGKTRLIDEIRIRAVVKGLSVQRGQSVAEGRSPYQVWREVIRQLIVYIDISDDEASILKPLVADIGDYVGKDIPDAPPLEPPAALARLLATVEGVLRRYDRPTMIILQDLHWMGDESLALLQHLVNNLTDRPILFLGGFRDDERPNLPEQLPGVETMHLERFNLDTIAQLTQSMIGVPTENKPILDYLQRQTEGNIYFLIETVRILAEEAGKLEDIAFMTLPETVLSSGMERIIRRRLETVPGALHRYLEIAAIIGRSLDRQLMERIAPDMQYDGWLTACANAAVLDVQDANWRFAHDKLREQLLTGLETDDKRQLHRQVAESIEAVYGATPETIATLAHHYREAQIPEKAVPYLVQASNQALANGLPRESLEYGLSAVRMLGVEMPTTPQAAGQAIGAEVGQIQGLMAGKSLADLKNLPKSNNEPITQAIGIMLQIAPAANIAQMPEFYVLTTLRNFHLTLEHGSHPFAGAVFSVFASIFHINMTGDIQGGGELATLAVEIDEAWGRPMRAFVLFVNQWLNLHWTHPLKMLPDIAAEASQLGFETNFLVFGCFSAAAHAMWHLRIGTPLGEAVEHARNAHKTIGGRVSSSAFHALHEMQLAKALMGKTENPLSLSDDEFNEEADIASVMQSQNVNQMAYYLWSKAMLHYLYGDSGAARTFAENMLPIKVTVQGQMLEWEFDFFYTLILLDTGAEDMQAARDNRAKFKRFGEINPATFGHKSQIIEAEIARLEGRIEDAYTLFDEATNGASAEGFHLYAALAQERKGQLALNSHADELGRAALDSAMQHYANWGARAKVADITTRYRL